MHGDEIQRPAGRRPGTWAASTADGGDRPTLGRGQTSAVPRIDADIEAIQELRARIRHLWPSLTVPSRADLTVQLGVLSAAVERRETDTRTVRKALQQVLLNVGTGALAFLSESSRQRLGALTGIAIPGWAEDWRATASPDAGGDR